ncbi:MAG: lamin tail domain-containing protein [Candidatus Poribacteria bacterium]|nr:lamin tail domain-containing protein [Candidatus Poribacteria bacterium]
MRLSNKSTFSLVCLIALFVLAAMPAMAQTIEAEWVADVDDGTAGDQNGWDITIGGLTAADTVAVTFLDINGAAAANATGVTVTSPVPADETSTTGTILANVGVEIAVQVVAGASGSEVTYQRVTFPAGGPGATLASTDLVRLPKLMDLTVSQYYMSFGEEVTVTFNFAAAVADTNGAPMAPLHQSDVTIDSSNSAGLQIVSVSGTNMVTFRSNLGATGASGTSTVTLHPDGSDGVFALQAATPADGQAMVTFDATAPTITARTGDDIIVSAPPGFPTPADGVWDRTFTLAFSAADEADGSGLAEDLNGWIVTDSTKLDVEFVGLGADDTTVAGTEYLVRITPKATRTTTAGEPVTITVMPSDKAGNQHVGMSVAVKLAAKTQPITPPSPATISTPDLGMTTAGATLTITFSKDPGAVMHGTTTLAGTGTARMLMVPATQGAGTHSVALTWTGTNAGSSDDGSGTVTYTIPAPPAMDTGDNISPVITIPAAASEGAHNSNGDASNSFVVVVRDMMDATIPGTKGLAFRDEVTVVEWPDMPDLERLFYTGNDGVILGGGGGGALILTESVTHAGDDLAPGTVGISEIMWGIDANFLGDPDQDAYAGSQWIELHNLNAAEVKVVLSWKTGRDITSDSTITGNLAHPKLDVVTNFFNDRPGAARWEVPGSNGASVGGVNFVSMARKGTFSKLRRHENKTDKDFNSRYTRTGGAGNSPDGRSSGQWAGSSAAYLRLRTTLTDQTDVVYEFVGTPGRVNTFSAESQPHIRASRRDVPASPVIFNEIANRADSHSRYEWIELRNVTDGKVNLRNWLISIVTSNSSDAVFYQFPNNNNAQIEPQGVLLLVASDPRGNSDHPLAVGWNVDDNPEDQPRGLAEIGITASSKHGRYKVADTGAAGMFGGDRNGLPDDGKFVLILRSQDNHDGQRSGVDGGKGVAETGNNDLNRVVDIAGWDDDVGKNSYPNAVSSTTIWPLHQMTRGVFSHNRLDADKVHYRRHRTTPDGMAGAGAHENKNEGGKTAYARGVGYSGIGYKRQAMDSGVHGGDPGYHGMTRNSAHDNDGGSRVYISEIMLSQGDGRTKLPQWIELYNASDYAVNLSGGDGVGWRLVIENPDDPIRTINFRSKGNVKTINPKQTVLIISGSARSFGSDHLPSSTVFPDTRVFNVYKELKGHFDMAGRTSAIINPTAFNIKLIDGGKKINDVVTYTTSDEIGNLDGNARTNDQGMWEYPMSVTEDGYRSSLIRIFDGGTPREGLSMMESNVKPLGGTEGEGVDGMDGIDMKYSWVHAADTDFVDIFVRHTWYGSENDFGTPANRAAQVLPVELSSFRPALEDGQVVVRWATESELDNAGFNILRSEERDGEYKQVNTELIAGNGTTGERNTYKWVDATAKPGVVYYYQIEDVSFAGERQALAITKLKGLISAQNKLTTTWGELKEVQ